MNANTADISHLNSQNACIEVYVTRALVLGVTVKICVELDESADIEAIVLNLYNVTLSSSKFNSGQVEDHRTLRDMDMTPLKTTFSELIIFLIRAQQIAPSCHPEWGNMEKLGEHGEVRERGEHEKDGKHQPDDLKYSIYDSKHSICDSKYSFWQLDDSKNSFWQNLYLRHSCRQSKKIIT